MGDIRCPYCGECIEIDHDDGYGYEENVIHRQTCWNCDKEVGYNVTIIRYYDAVDVPCFNGGVHELVDLTIYPKAFGVGKKRCKHCEEEFLIDAEAHRKAMVDYYEKMNKMTWGTFNCWSVTL